MRTRLRDVALGIVAVGVAMVVGELALRLFYPASSRHFVLMPGETVILTPLERYMQGVSGPAVYRTSSDGIRGDEFGAEDEYRILAIGGSTTQNAYLDQSETWTLLLGDLIERERGVPTWSGDIGRSGHTARSHVLQFEYILPELPRIDAVVMLMGVNDVGRTLRKGYNNAPDPPLSDPAARAEQMREAFMRVPGRLHDRSTMYLGDGVAWFKRLALYQLARIAKERWEQARAGTSQDLIGEVYGSWRANRSSAARFLDSLPELSNALDQYRSYLSEIATLAVARDVRLVFVTQPTLWRKDLSDAEKALLWLGGVGDFQNVPGQEYFSVGVLREAMDSFNAALMSVCESYAVECFDLASMVPRDTVNFYDDVHFTERGSRLVAHLLAEYLTAAPAKTIGAGGGGESS